MHYAQDPKHKAPTLSELVSDLSLQYIAMEKTLDDLPEGKRRELVRIQTESQMATLANVLFTITGHREWTDKADRHRTSAMRLSVDLLKNLVEYGQDALQLLENKRQAPVGVAVR